ncbi:MAG TPA: twin-arginine translocase TatA/TatE family subunit [Solirubrobacter sp.]
MELIVVLVIALVVLGPKRLPDAGKSLGRGIREFKGSLSGDGKDDDEREERELAAIQPAVAEPERERVA